MLEERQAWLSEASEFLRIGLRTGSSKALGIAGRLDQIIAEIERIRTEMEV
jgi:hypothetical protein